MYKMKKQTITKAIVFSAIAAFAISAAPVFAAGQTSNLNAIAKLDAAKSNYQASVRKEAIMTGNAVPQQIATGPASAWLSKVSADEVNMVTNRFESRKQEAVQLAGKTYFTTGAVYAKNLAENASIRFAIDPVSSKKVDKAEAVIFADASGKAFYFESEESFKNFIALATPETVFGYSEPK